MAKIAQLEAATDKFYDNMGDKAEDIYFETSYFLKFFLQDKKGLYKTVSGGRIINVPIRFDGNVSDWFVRGGILNSDHRDSLTAVEFPWKYAHGNATILQTDAWENRGTAKIVDLLKDQLYGGQESLRDKLATSFYTGAEGATDLTGLNACCNTDADVAYGGYTENEIVSVDGDKVWTGNETTTASTEITLNVLRTLKSEADWGKGKYDEPDLGSLHKDLYNHLKSQIDTQQRFTSDDSAKAMTKIGFMGFHFEGTDLYKDRYCPSGNAYLMNSLHLGFRVNPDANLTRGPWHVIANTAEDKTMNFYFGGNLVCNNRRAMNRHSGLTTS